MQRPLSLRFRRRNLLRLAGVWVAGASFGLVPSRGKALAQAGLQTQPTVVTGRTWRTISYNVLAFKGYPETDGNRARLPVYRRQYIRRLALELELYRPDIITLQESPTETAVAELAKELGFQYTYFPGGFPGTLLTPHSILASENCPIPDGTRPTDLFTRHWGKAVVDFHGTALTIYSAHLHPSQQALRDREVDLALEVMKSDIGSEKPMIFQGDLNHLPDGPEYNRWKAAGLIDVFDRPNQPTPGPTFPSVQPDRRIDYIWVNRALAERLRSAEVLFEGAFRTQPDPRSIALSDHLPVLAEFTL